MCLMSTFFPTLSCIYVHLSTLSSILAWENPMDRGAWWATVHQVAKSRTQLKRLSTKHDDYLLLLVVVVYLP